MLKISYDIINKIKAANTIEELHEYLQAAMALEHATLPPYLTALYSLKNDPQGIVTDILQSTILEEMLHLTIAGNLLIALGGKPVINSKDFVPQYPCQLPIIIDSVIVGLQKFSCDLIKNVFMEIEKPDDTTENPASEHLHGKVAQYGSIGDFYKAIKSKVAQLPDTAFQNADLQVTSNFYDAALLFKITNSRDAAAAIEIIIEQGEGTGRSPEAPVVGGTEEPAHYFRFKQIIKGRKLIQNAEKKFVFGGDQIDVNALDVYPLWDNTKITDLAGDAAAYKALNDFNASYTQLLAALHATFNGNPGNLDRSFGMMRTLKRQATAIVAMPFPGKPGYNIGLSFEYTPSVPAGS